MQDEGEIKGFGDGLVGDVVVARPVSIGKEGAGDMYVSWLTYVGPMPPLDAVSEYTVGKLYGVNEDVPGHDKVVPLAHAADSLDDLRFVVLNHLDPFQILLW